ncbi:MAG: serine protease [Pseudomonadota bacterium]
MRVPDWVIYVVALAAVLYGLYSNGPSGANAPPPVPEEIAGAGALLSPPSAFDERILIQTTAPQDGVGTAFAVTEDGDWLTARHVVEGCSEVGLIVGRGAYVPVRDIRFDERSDLALLSTGRAPAPAPMDLQGELRVGDEGYHVGFPQGRPGEATARLLARSRLVTRGARRGDEPVLAWSEVGRTRGIDGSLGGLSGGPVFDASGRVRGVVVAESPRRGRIYTAAPASVAAFLERNDVEPETDGARLFNVSNYGAEADRARRNLQVVKVACQVTE